MADITKQIKLKASLDSSELKSQIAELKKELNQGLSFNNNDLKGLEKTFENIASKFADKIGKAISDLKAADAKVGGGKGINARDDFDKQQDDQWKSTAKRLDKEEKARIKSEKVVEKERAKAEDRLADLREDNLNEQIRNSQLDRSPTAKALKAMGMSPEAARSAAGSVEGMGGLTGMAGKLGGMVTGGLAVANGITDLQRTATEREFRYSGDISQGKFLEAGARKEGREGNFITRNAGMLGGIGGALVGGFTAGPIGAVAGAYAGAKLGQHLQEGRGELSVEELKPLMTAFAKAQALAPSRLEALRGGGISSGQLTGLQNAGAENGFTAAETVQQMLTARGTLGNTAAGQLLTGMQGVKNTTGIDIGTQSNAIETMAGVSGGTRTEGYSKQIDAIKKGVAAGLDISKSGAFLRTTSQYLESNVGMGTMDVGNTNTKLAEFAKGFAGGGDVTDIQISQARKYAEMTKRESASDEGLAGAGNMLLTQQALGPDASMGQLLRGTTFSSDATADTLRKSGVPEDKIQAMLAAKKPGAALDYMSNLASGGDEDLQAYLTTKTRGQYGEEYKGTQNAMNAQGTLKVGTGEAASTAAAGQVANAPEMQLAKGTARLDVTEVAAGLDTFDKATRQAAIGLNALVEDLLKAKNRMSGMDAFKLSGGQ